VEAIIPLGSGLLQTSSGLTRKRIKLISLDSVKNQGCFPIWPCSR
jgi:hypothetical protein